MHQTPPPIGRSLAAAGSVSSSTPWSDRSIDGRRVIPLTVIMLVLSSLIAVTARGEDSEYVDAGRGDVRVVLPSDRDPGEPLPLILLLHSFAYSGEIQEAYFRFAEQVDEQRFILCLPDGNRNFTGQRFWNATPACCDLFNQNPDDDRSNSLLLCTRYLCAPAIFEHPLSLSIIANVKFALGKRSE